MESAELSHCAINHGFVDRGSFNSPTPRQREEVRYVHYVRVHGIDLKTDLRVRWVSVIVRL
jgi:hypothetical protein